MGNTLTALLPALTTAMLAVLNENAPLPKICNADFKTDEAALNETVTIPTAPAVAGINRTSAAIFTQAADRAVTTTTISLTKDRAFPFYMNGEDYRKARQNPDYVPASMKEAIRAWRNEMQSDLAAQHINAAGYYSANTPSSGAAYGTAGTAPLGSGTTDVANIAKLLNDSLCPLEDRYLLIDTAAQASVQGNSQLVKSNEAGTDQLLREGLIGRLGGFNVAWMNDVKLSTIGTGTGYLTNGTQAAGVATIAVNTGSGTVVAGDVITFAGDTTKYVVSSSVGGGTVTSIVLTSGLVNAVANGVAVSIGAASRRNLALHRSALGLAVRIPAMPPGGDMAVDRQVVVDPMSGLSCLVSHYKGYGMEQFEIGSVWGVKAVRPTLLKLLLG